jgi:hypothetical protein
MRKRKSKQWYHYERYTAHGFKASAAEIKSGSGDINAVAEVISTASRGNVANVLEPELPAGL